MFMPGACLDWRTAWYAVSVTRDLSVGMELPSFNLLNLLRFCEVGVYKCITVISEQLFDMLVSYY
jgi:hypothetical protein